jgi:hypothetical protein
MIFFFSPSSPRMTYRRYRAETRKPVAQGRHGAGKFGSCLKGLADTFTGQVEPLCISTMTFGVRNIIFNHWSIHCRSAASRGESLLLWLLLVRSCLNTVMVMPFFDTHPLAPPLHPTTTKLYQWTVHVSYSKHCNFLRHTRSAPP